MKKIVLVFCYWLPLIVMAQPVSVDQTFGDAGFATIQVSLGTNFNSIVAQANGSLICAGSFSDGAWLQPALVRCQPNGKPDSSFGVNGAAISFLPSAYVVLRAVVIQPDGKIIVAGYTGAVSLSSTDFLIARYLVNGRPDSSFGINGFVTKNLGPFNNWLHDVKLQSDGKIVAAGQSFNGAHYVFAAVRYNNDGTEDNDFNGNGSVTVDANVSNSQCLSLDIQQDDKIVLAGFSNDINDRSLFTVARLKTNGALDSSFGSNGLSFPVTNGISSRITDIVVLPDGKLVACGEVKINSGRSDAALLRLQTDGLPDSSFGTNGMVQTNLPVAGIVVPNKILLQQQGKILLAGSLGYLGSGGTDEILLMRHKDNGSLDSSFDQDGIVTTIFPEAGYYQIPSRATIYGNRIFVVGSKANFIQPNNGLVVAYLNDAFPLPLRLLQFTASNHVSGIRLQWQTVAETRGSSFVIQKSIDGYTFYDIANLASLGLSSGSSYHFIDMAKEEKQVFYRLKLLDADGQFTWSPVIRVATGVQPFSLLLYPNPVREKLVITANGLQGETSFLITNAEGKIVRQWKQSVYGSAVVNIDIHSLPGGTYFLLLINKSGFRQQQFIKI